MRATVIANGILTRPVVIPPGDLLIAADGGARHCFALGLTPDYAIGDFDSLTEADLAALEAAGVQLLRYPARKDYTDLELAIRLAKDQGADEIVIVAALGARWDQTMANLLLPAAEAYANLRISLLDGPQEIRLIRPAEVLEVPGHPGDTLSLIPLWGDAHGIDTKGLEYPLKDGTLMFGSTRGISNVFTGEMARIALKKGLLLCVVIHLEEGFPGQVFPSPG